MVTITLLLQYHNMYMHANQQMMVYPMYQDQLQQQAQTPVSLGQQQFTAAQQPIYYAPQAAMQVCVWT